MQPETIEPSGEGVSALGHVFKLAALVFAHGQFSGIYQGKAAALAHTAGRDKHNQQPCYLLLLQFYKMVAGNKVWKILF